MEGWSNGYLRVEQAHNDYLQVLTDLGVLGGIYMLGFLFLFFKYSLKTIFSNESKNKSYTNYKIAAFVGCCAIFIHSFFDFNLQIPSNAFLFLVLCLCSTLQFSENIVLESH